MMKRQCDGSGYPFQLKGDELDMESRIISIADIFQALSQNRPYRGRLSIEEIKSVMTPLVDKGQLDQEVYQIILENQERYYQAAIVENNQ